MVGVVTSGFKTVSAVDGQVRATRQQVLTVRNSAASDTVLFCLVFKIITRRKKH